MATAALVCGIVGLPLFVFVPIPIVALVLGLVAAGRAKRSGRPDGGLGRARAGWILGLIGVLAFAALMAGTAITGGFDDDVSVYDLEVNDCVDVPDETGVDVEVTELPSIDCDDPHDAEVFLIDELDADGEYPGTEAVTGEVQRQCVGAAFEDFVGQTYARSELDIFYMFPTQQTWDLANDREFVCAVTTVDGSPLVGSVEGSER